MEMTSKRQILFLGNLLIFLNAQGGDACGGGSSSLPVPRTTKPTPLIYESTTPYGTMEITTILQDKSTTAEFNELEQQLNLVDDILSRENVTSEDVQIAAEIIANATNNVELVEKDTLSLNLILTSLELVVGMEDPSVEVTEPVVRAVNNIMDLGEQILQSTLSEAGRFVSALEQQISALQTKDGNFSQILPNLGILAVKINATTMDSNLTFANIGHIEEQFFEGEDLREDNIGIFNGDEFIDDDKRSVASVSVPLDALGLNREANKNITKIPVSFSIYGNTNLFVPSKPLQPVEDELDNSLSETITESIASQVVSVRIEDNGYTDTLSLQNLTFVARFITNLIVENDQKVVSRHCVAWNDDKKTRKRFWSEKGCKTTLNENDKRLTLCSCNRPASFAVLFRVRKGHYNTSVPLSYISLIGSIISATCLVFCIITFISMKQLRSKQPTHIHINLCTSLLGLYIAFLFVGLAVRDMISCTVLSAAIHFFCLATAFWMSVEAVNMYCTFIKIKPRGIRFFIPIASLFAYGCPAVITILVSIFDKSSDYEKVQYCFIQPGKALYFGFLTEVAILFLLNFIIFALVIRKVIFRPLLVSRTIGNAKRNEIITRVRHGISFWFVLGLSWIFGFLSAADSKTMIFHYLFCIFISLQGFIMFLMLCVGNPEFRKVFSKFFNSPQTSATVNLTDLGQSRSPRHDVKT